MIRRTVADLKSSRVPEALNLSSTDSRFLVYANECTERLLHRGKFWGTFGRYLVSVSSQLMSVPPEVATTEKIAVARWPLPLRSQFYEFMDSGWGTRDSSLPNGSGVPEVLDRGQFPVVTDVDATAPSVLNLKCDVASDVGKSVLVLGEDENGNWVRTLSGGIWSDGEPVLLAQGAGTNTAHQFSRVTGLQPPSTLDGQWWLYQGITMLGNYQYWEQSPSYQRLLIPFVNSTVTTVELMGKKAFRPVSKDTDYLIIGNLAAMKLGMLACKAEEEGAWTTAALLWSGGQPKNSSVSVTGAVQELDNELHHNLGDGYETGFSVKSSSIGQVDPVENLI